MSFALAATKVLNKSEPYTTTSTNQIGRRDRQSDLNVFLGEAERVTTATFQPEVPVKEEELLIPANNLSSEESSECKIEDSQEVEVTKKAVKPIPLRAIQFKTDSVGLKKGPEVLK
jgi:hypothetical protein